MFRQLNFRSFFNFLGRNKLYAAINIFGLSVSLMFVILIADYTLRQLTCDDYHAKADRIYVIGNEERITSGYYLQKYLRDRYPEIESTCAVAVSGQSTDATQPVEVGLQKYSATILFADTTFFRIFDYQLLDGDREQVLASRDNVVLSESFARKVFGTFNPMGQVIRFPDEEKSYVVSGVVRDIDRSVIPNMDIIMRAERLCDINSANDEHMSNSGAVTTFILARPGADLTAKIPDMLDYFKEIYWIYKGNVYQHVTLTPLRDVYFLSQNNDGGFNYGSWPFVMILFGVGAVILLFAVINYINLTVAQTGFRAKEMAARRLLGASRGEIILKLILESTFLCVVAFVIAFFLAAAVEPGASRLLGSKIGVWQDMTPAVVACYAAFIVVLGVVAGFIPAMMVSRYKPVDIVRGSFRHRTKMFYSKVLITIQNVITIVLIATSLTIGLQIRHLISAPMGYNTADILDVSTEIFTGKPQIAQFREELLREPCVEAVALGCGTPHDRGNNNTMQYGPDRMIGFQIFIGDSTYFRILGLERLRDNHLATREDGNNALFVNQYALQALGIAEDATNFKVGENYTYNYDIAGVYRDFQLGSALDELQPVLLKYYDSPEEFLKKAYPWNILVKIRGDKTAAYNTVKSVFERISDGAVFTGAEYIEQEIEADYAQQRRILHIVGIFTLVAILISALGLVAMSTYYIQQKEQEVAVRKVFGSTRGEVLTRLVGNFMRLVGAAFVIAVPVAWYLLERWLQDYSVRISLSPLIFLASGAFAAVVAFVAVFWQSSRAADSNPVDSIKN
ncbi:ABC transporter permease [Alistipes onderdonkii]|uniref:ABC transporter permease n=1 Tax=Alistipes onderdonkii TaxID=328813 RepID=UPI001EDF1B16|nr:ABC transporter permease [Alistipes onderdonkii]MCG4859974.1 ABC transporter permease [Alistipes onderdonkii]